MLDATYRIIQILDLLHQPHHCLILAVANVWLLRDAKPMLSTNTAVPLLHPLVHKRLQRLLHVLAEPACGNVQVQVSVSHVAVANNVDDGVVWGVADKPSLCESVSCVVDEIVQLGDGDRQVVLVDATLVAENFGDAFAPRPQLSDLGLVVG
jgi:hypothetical protein